MGTGPQGKHMGKHMGKYMGKYMGEPMSEHMGEHVVWPGRAAYPSPTLEHYMLARVEGWRMK
jgi:hypothetical protein